jgi:acyl-CoA reductase-like NAD-dependent aldehyde dehydrogenase
MEKTINMFELATRKKFRFPFKGMISVEDLWDLSVKNLDTVFKALNAEAKQANEESLLAVKSDEDTILEAKIAIVKHIVNVKQAEEAEKVRAAANRAQARRIQELIANKQDEALQGKSIEELQAMLSALDV